MQMCSTIVAVCLTATAIQPTAALACGYDNPQSIALGSLNGVYPDALHVRTAVAKAEAAGTLPVEKTGAQSGPLAFYRATAAMKSFGTKLADPHLATAGIAVSVVLIPQAMWTRFEIGSQGVVVHGHAEGPVDSDLVVVTEETVIRALVDGSLDAAAAEESGLLRFYGDTEQIEMTRAALSRTGKNGQALPVRFSAPAPASPSRSAERGSPESRATY